MPWSFALVNHRLAEIFFKKTPHGKNKIWGHCYVKKSEYKTKQEQEWIRKDTAQLQFVYRKRKYLEKNKLFINPRKTHL